MPDLYEAITSMSNKTSEGDGETDYNNVRPQTNDSTLETNGSTPALSNCSVHSSNYDVSYTKECKNTMTVESKQTDEICICASLADQKGNSRVCCKKVLHFATNKVTSG